MRFELGSSREASPLYVQLAKAIEDHITLKRLKPGDLLPSETVLASVNQLSRATVIKAFDTLVDRGVVTRRQGRGTFVSARPMERQLPELTSFSEHVHGLGLTPGSVLLSFANLAPRAPERPDSPYMPEEPLAMIERLRTVEDSPVGLHRTLVPADVAEKIGLDERSAAKPGFSLYRALTDSGIYLTSGEETLRAINADAHDAELLAADEGIALIEVVRYSRDADGRLVEVVRARYLGSQYLYQIAFAPTLPGGPREQAHSSSTRTGGGLAPRPDSMRG